METIKSFTSIVLANIFGYIAQQELRDVRFLLPSSLKADDKNSVKVLDFGLFFKCAGCLSKNINKFRLSKSLLTSIRNNGKLTQICLFCVIKKHNTFNRTRIHV